MYLFGASGHAKVVISNLESQGELIHGLFDDDPSVGACLGYPVFRWGGVKRDSNYVLVSIGDNRLRELVVSRIAKEVIFGKAIHRNAMVSNYAEIAEGTAVMAGAVIQPDAIIGAHAIINTGASVDHDCRIGDFVHIGPQTGLCGDVQVGKGTLIGAGSTLLPGVTVGENCVIGAGSTVLRDVQDGEKVWGIVK
ncbi:acetyltransferase [Echinicola vietnamensis]|uniref:Sugar O-acyltransferase, sialic acid O-acetyltransferase NeuD family n=1 Tax=Echinicola vietnamensis (strain DSM 17526 / LMG 23754 / KMM 6221) TaxID=926556 RepID=L0FZ32_ECHVK|nr:acetyltransferase [Echinicola vietnamensis]AGA78537.1 sugar O-acyltransferase, sialic acid O-acetyltransferase NeuD family [Echinicola vietnamensis DSM 17526]